MPELPEVETTVRYLRKKIIGRKIKEFWTDWPKGIKNISPAELNRKLKGKSFSAVSRRGKNILIEIDKRATLWIHLKMTGHLLLRPLSFLKTSPFSERVNQYIHYRFILDNKEELAFSDLRKFARITYLPEPTTNNLITNNFKDLGIEPLSNEFTEKIFKDLLDNKKNENKQLKIFLLDQSQIAGIGNIYASEILFEARLDPKRKAGSLNSAETKFLHKAIRNILEKAIKTRGTSISDFRDPDGKPGGYGNVRLVYQKKGQPCPKCKKPIESFKQGQRTTFWCPECQH